MNASVVLYAPAFDFKVVPGAANYRFRLVVEESGKAVEFTADTPCRPLSPVWAKLPKTATINLTVDALDAGGEVVARSGERKIYKSAPFTGDYPKSKMKWREVAKKVFEYLLDCKEGKYFRANKAPEPNHKTNCYPSKQCSATIRSMISLADIAPERAKETLEFARINADYLIGESEGEKARLPYFPPTYTRTPMAGELKVAKMFRAQVMLDYPPAVGSAFLALYLKTGEKKYFDQAVGIAETLLKSQLPCGTWPLKMDLATGEMVGTNLLVPGNVIGFFDGLFAATGDGCYREAGDRACGYYDGLFKSWNWEGQFEDVTTLTPPAYSISHWR